VCVCDPRVVCVFSLWYSVRMKCLDLCWLLLLVAGVYAIEGKSYKEGDPVAVYANFLGPYANPDEIYPFYPIEKECSSYGLAWCPLPAGGEERKKPTTLAEKLEGDRPVLAPMFDFRFKKNMKDAVMCVRTLDTSDIQLYHSAIAQSYYYQLVIDDLPVRGSLGMLDDRNNDVNIYLLFTHFDFSISYNEDRIIQINVSVSSKDMVDVSAVSADGKREARFVYSVHWIPTTTAYADRMSLYETDNNSEKMNVHWISVKNSLLLALLMTGFLVLLVVRVVKNDFIRYGAGNTSEVINDALERGEKSSVLPGGVVLDEDDDNGKTKDYMTTNTANNDYGWKLVHGDVFRFPKNKTLFCVLIGYGVQILAVMVGVFLLGVAGVFAPEMSGSIYVAGIVLYALSAGISGFVSSRLFRQMGGKRWAWVVLLLMILYPVTFAAVVLYMDFVAVAHYSIRAIRFTTMLEVSSIYLFVGVPITFLGSILGRNTASDFVAPCRTKVAPREIPEPPWYMTTPFQILVAGFLPFSSIFVELFYIYSSIWGHSYYGLYGILVVVFSLLLLVSASVTITITYFLLSVEDYRWWWGSFIYGGSISFFIFGYSVIYWYQSQMNGFLQGSFYFGYVTLVCLSMFIMLGSVGFFGSLAFVKYLYSRLKLD